MAGKTKKVTIESLARMVARGFDDSKKDIDGLRKDIDGLRMETRSGFERLEKLILADHKRRIERLEVEMRELKSLLAM